MEDKFGREHNYLRISLTDKCNLACSYCMPDAPCYLPNTQLLSPGEIHDIAAIFVRDLGINKIRLTGGEPLIRKNAGDIIEALSTLPVDLGITTNGVLLGRFFSLFERIGLHSLNISLDSLNRERFKGITGRDQFDTVIGNIEEAIDRGFDVKINTVVKLDMNADEIFAFAELTRNLPVHVRMIEFMPFDANRWLWDKVVPFVDILQKISAVYELEKLDDAPSSTSKNYKIRGFRGSFGVISTVTSPFCSGCNRIRLTADGKLRNCLFDQAETDLLPAFRRGEDIVPLIKNSIWHKFAERGGLVAFDSPEAESVYAGGRSMTAIGG